VNDQIKNALNENQAQRKKIADKQKAFSEMMGA